MDIATTTWLALGFGLGLVHAFDADHVMALSVFASRGRGASDGVWAGIRWSLGHGLVLIVVGLVLLVLGRAMPPSFSVVTERGVGFVMIALGVWAMALKAVVGKYWPDVARKVDIIAKGWYCPYRHKSDGNDLQSSGMFHRIDPQNGRGGANQRRESVGGRR